MTGRSGTGLFGLGDGRVPMGVSWVGVRVAGSISRDPAHIHTAADVARSVIEAEAEFAFVSGEESWAHDCALILMDHGVQVVWTMTGPFGVLIRRMGWPAAITMLHGDGSDGAPELDEALDEALDVLAAGVLTGVSTALLADDVSSDQGWLVVPDAFVNLLMPRYERWASAVRDAGLVPLFHSDGDVSSFYGDLARSGFEGVHLAPSRMGADFETAAVAARRAGMVVLGGIEASTLGSGDPRDIARQLITIATRVPLAVCDDGGITEPAQVRAMAEILRAVRVQSRVR